MALPRFWVLRDAQAESGHHVGDLFVEVGTVVFSAATTATINTKFATTNNIIAIFLTKQAASAVYFNVPHTVSSSQVTVTGSASNSESVDYMIIGRLDV